MSAEPGSERPRLSCRLTGEAGMVEFRLLGPVCLRCADRVVDLGTPKQRAVLVALLVDAGRPVSVDTLIARVWGDDPPGQARSALYTHVMRIRRLAEEAPDPPVLLTRGPAGYTIEVDRGAVDLFRFQDLVARAADPDLDDEDRLAMLREALARWAGQPLADLGGDWVERTREAWRRQYLDAAVAWARAELRIGDPGRVPGPVRALATEYPLVEPLTAVLLEALGTVGRAAEALDYYAGFRHRLAEELGTDPGSELRAVHQALLRGEYDHPAPAPAVRRWTAPAVRRRLGRRPTKGMVASWCLTVAALVACFAVVPLIANSGHPVTATPPAPRAATWVAHTVSDAPLFVESGQLILTVPAHARVRVSCQYSGRPPSPWRSGGTEYHVVAPSSGHIPDQYLAFEAPAPAGLPHCHAKPPRPSGTMPPSPTPSPSPR